MKAIQVVEVIGYATGGIIAVAQGNYVIAAKAFILAASSLVDPDVASEYLTAAGVDRANMIADVGEVMKFGALS